MVAKNQLYGHVVGESSGPETQRFGAYFPNTVGEPFIFFFWLVFDKEVEILGHLASDAGDGNTA
jgi:hypothetical protein